MIAFDNDTKNAYKDYMREIQVYGNLYLAKKRLSNNLLEQEKYVSTQNLIYNNGIFKQITAGATVSPAIQIQKYQNDVYIETISSSYIELGVVKFSFVKTNEFNQISYKANDSSLDTTVRFNISNLTNGKTYYIGATFTNITQGNIQWENMYINENNSTYEEYGTMVNDYTLFPLTEENECKILEFNINEKTDPYYTSLPYNTLTLELDNEKGYFTDYDENSIVNKLNQDCYVDLFIKINDGDYYKIMTMNFDKISSSDYEKAKLSFKSSIAFLKNLPFRDKYKYLDSITMNRNEFKEYLYDNYKINLIHQGNITAFNCWNQKTSSVENMLLECGTRYGTLSTACLVTNDYQNNISLKNWLSTPQDTITKDYQLEKPIIKRENTYQGVDILYVDSSSYETTNETYERKINGILQATKEVRVYRDNNYKLDEIVISDLTPSTGITISLDVVNTNTILITINGSLGQEYTISIVKSNIKRKAIDNIEEKKYGVTTDTSKILKIEQSSPLLYNYFELIFGTKDIRSYVEAKIMALPYIEVGDTIEVQTDNANILITVIEIDMNYDGGLIETIKGYELSWDTLFPSDTLYPSDNLYPNTPI